MRSQLSHLITSYLLNSNFRAHELKSYMVRGFHPWLPKVRDGARNAIGIRAAEHVVSPELAGPAPTLLRLSPSLPNVRSHPCPTPRAGCDDGCPTPRAGCDDG